MTLGLRACPNLGLPALSSVASAGKAVYHLCTAAVATVQHSTMRICFNCFTIDLMEFLPLASDLGFTLSSDASETEGLTQVSARDRTLLPTYGNSGKAITHTHTHTHTHGPTVVVGMGFTPSPHSPAGRVLSSGRVLVSKHCSCSSAAQMFFAPSIPSHQNPPTCSHVWQLEIPCGHLHPEIHTPTDRTNNMMACTKQNTVCC